VVKIHAGRSVLPQSPYSIYDTFQIIFKYFYLNNDFSVSTVSRQIFLKMCNSRNITTAAKVKVLNVKTCSWIFY